MHSNAIISYKDIIERQRFIPPSRQRASLLDIQTNFMKMRTVINLEKDAYLEWGCMKLRMIIHISDVIILQSLLACVCVNAVSVRNCSRIQNLNFRRDNWEIWKNVVAKKIVWQHKRLTLFHACSKLKAAWLLLNFQIEIPELETRK